MLNATQLVTVAEITQETYATVESLSSSLTAEQETAISADVITWNLNRDDVDVLLKGGSSGVDYSIQRLLNAIRERTRKALGLPLYSEEVQPTSGAIANRFVF